MGSLRIVALLVISASLAGCLGAVAPPVAYVADPQVLLLPQWTVYQGSAGSLSYQTAVGRDGTRFIAGPRVQGRACQHGLQLPVFGALALTATATLARGPSSLSAGWGQGGYQAAVADAKRQLAPEAVLYDVRADLRHRLILTVYHEQCVIVDAGVLLPLSG